MADVAGRELLAVLPALVDGRRGVRARRRCSIAGCTRRVQQSAGERRSAGRARDRSAGSDTRLLTPFGIVRRELVLKELRLFFRDTTQWSQLILLAVLVVVYVFNIKYLPLRGEGVTFFLVNVVPFLNLVLAGFVLASIAARFIFPGVSLEGRTLLAAALEPDVDARAALVQVLGRHAAAARPRAGHRRRHRLSAAGHASS